MSLTTNFEESPLNPSANRSDDATFSGVSGAALPLGALLLAGSLAAGAQTVTAPTTTLQPVTVSGEKEEGLRARRTTIGKGEQDLRDVPQSVTVVTEQLMDERNLTTLKEVLKNTSGITFLAAEGGEEDIRLRGFPLQATGDVFVDGMRDPAFYDRDTFSFNRVEVLRGSASMLFGRGSTGGAVNMVTKVPRLMDEHQVDVTVGNHQYRRVVGDFNFKTGERAALRMQLMRTQADNNGAGTALDKSGLNLSYRWGIATADEFSVSLYHLDNRNGMNYGLPWIRSYTGAPASATTVLPLDPTAYYGMASDINAGRASYFTLSHRHWFDDGSELTTKLRRGAYARNQRASTIRFCQGSTNASTGQFTSNALCPGVRSVTLDNFGPNTVLTRGNALKIQDLDSVYAQSDYSKQFQAWGLKHELLAGVDYAHEKKVVFGARSAAQGGIVPTKPTTRIGTPGDGAWIDEAVRVISPTSRYTSDGVGVYAQDLVQLNPHWKLLAGLRYDHLRGDYDTLDIVSGKTSASYRMTVSEWSKRFGVLWQPSELQSFHASVANSFNTSGDAYSLSASNVNTPPEQSINMELGARIDSEDKRLSTRFALFRTTKLHERNTDPLVNLTTLSGRRHVAGFEMDVAGRIGTRWEVYASYMWLPVARIDVPVTGGETGRPSLTPKHTGTLWATYKLDSQWRLGAGLNLRSSQTPNRNPGWSVPGYATVDAMAEYAYSEHLTLKANISNLSNRLYADQLYSGHYVPGAGRTVQLTASVKF
ncbi:MAG: TonB-dependent siderophore receptor [Pseudomonadota bacterium]